MGKFEKSWIDFQDEPQTEPKKDFFGDVSLAVILGLLAVSICYLMGHVFVWLV